jgi:hypothetical protein
MVEDDPKMIAVGGQHGVVGGQRLVGNRLHPDGMMTTSSLGCVIG